MFYFHGWIIRQKRIFIYRFVDTAGKNNLYRIDDIKRRILFQRVLYTGMIVDFMINLRVIIFKMNRIIYLVS